MERHWGLMTGEDLTIRKHLVDSHGLTILIEAGPHGWTIIYADQSSTSKDEDKSDLDNYNEALATAEKNLGKLTVRVPLYN